MIQATVPLLFLKEPSLILIAVPVMIACATANPWSVDNILPIA